MNTQVARIGEGKRYILSCMFSKIYYLWDPVILGLEPYDTGVVAVVARVLDRPSVSDTHSTNTTKLTGDTFSSHNSSRSNISCSEGFRVMTFSNRWMFRPLSSSKRDGSPKFDRIVQNDTALVFMEN